MGIHSGPCGTAVSVKYIWKPYFFIYGQAVEIAKLMGASSEPMKIQVSAMDPCGKCTKRRKHCDQGSIIVPKRLV